VVPISANAWYLGMIGFGFGSAGGCVGTAPSAVNT
jgi:hypothetical protein